jgi:hypothetical protein
MSQKLMYDIIKELGGNRVSIKQIIKLTKTKAPAIYVNKLLHSDLKGLRKWEYVSYDAQARAYTIIDKFPEPNIYHTVINEESKE